MPATESGNLDRNATASVPAELRNCPCHDIGHHTGLNERAAPHGVLELWAKCKDEVTQRFNGQPRTKIAAGERNERSQVIAHTATSGGQSAR
jgi:hypothetical protein